ncbi:MAG: cation:dicarboxylase symporter family transporter [Edaphocola sp.]
MRKKISFIAVFLGLFSSVATLSSLYKWLPINATILQVFWGLSLISLVAFAVLKKNLTTWILVSMAVGVFVGLEFPALALQLQVLSKVFLKLIKSIIGPILFSTLVVGIAGHSNLKQLGRMGWKSLLYFEIVTTIALAMGLLAINISGAGRHINIPPTLVSDLPKSSEKVLQQKIIAVLDSAHISHDPELLSNLPDAPGKTWKEHILDIFPENIAKSVAEGEVLPIVVFSVIFGIGLAMVAEERRKPMLNFTESLAETMFKFTNIIMYFAPFGVGAAIAHATAALGTDILFALGKLVLTLYCALIVFVAVVFGTVLYICKIPLKSFVKAIREPVSVAFATTSSESALPKAMENMEAMGVPRKIVSFVIPTGYTFNLDGTTLYLSVAAIFVAQAAGINLSIGQQLVMGLTLMLTSKGVAGVPRASLVILIGAAATFHLPLWPIMAIFGVDELMDMARTSVNVMGNCLASCVVARWEGELDDKMLANPAIKE